MNILLSISNAGEWIYNFIYLTIILLNIIFIILIISENRNPVKTIAWLSVLTLLPVVGFVFYLFFGRDQRSQRMISRRSKRKLERLVNNSISVSNTNIPNFKDATQQLIILGNKLTRAFVTINNKIDIFTCGKDKYYILFNDLKNAKSFIHIQYYIIENDNLGNQLKRLLIQKASEGVEVRVLYDDVGCWSLREKDFFDSMISAGIDAKPFFKVTFPQLANKLNYRNHRKVAIIDGTIGYVGGMNIADRYVTGGKWGEWRDTHIRIEGEAVKELQAIFMVDWNFTTKELLSDSSYFPKTKNFPNGATIQLLTSGPLDEHKSIFLMFSKIISNASERVFIQTPYFLPNSAAINALKIAALSGVDVRIMIPYHSDSKLLQKASNSYIAEMLKSNIKIYFYKKGFLHAKTILVDDEITSIGSTNFDSRSFEQNFEINAFIYDKEFNSRYAEIFMQDLKECRRVSIKSWNRRSIFSKIAESIARLFSPIL
ncbi:MAG: cardiolipin synthase [Bacteroidales bacterium]|nr:cardiolipin synthase [Bacteroidales bacterium]